MTSLTRYISSLGLVLVAGACNNSALETLGPNALEVAATLSSVSLAEDCQGSADLPGAEAPGADAAPCEPNSFGCQNYCAQSTMQLDLVAGTGKGAVDFEVKRVRLLDSASGAEVASITSREPQQWTESSYVTWDERIAPHSSLKVSYKLSLPTWAAGQSGGNDRGGFPQKTYRAEVEVLIDGVLRVLVLDGVSEEPPVAT